MKVSAQTKSEAKAIYEGTYNGQNLMKQIKEVIAIYLDYNKKNKYLLEQDKKYQIPIQMLLEGTDNVKDGMDFIRLEEEVGKVYAKYQMDKYSYELGIWKVGEKDQATWLSVPLEVDTDYGYKLKELVEQKDFEWHALGEGELIEKPPTLPDTIKGHFKITWARENNLLKSSLKVIGEKNLIKIQPEGEHKYILTSDTAVNEGEIKLIIDLTPLERWYEKVVSEDDIPLQPIAIENRTQLPLILNFVHLENVSKEEAEILSRKWVNIVDENVATWINGDYDAEGGTHQFKIILIVRQKHTALGEKGKVLKIIVDFYSPHKK